MKVPPVIKLPPVIMTPEEIEQADEEFIENEREFLERLQPEKPERKRPVQAQTLRTKEAAQYIGVSQWKLRQMAVTGQIPVIRGKYLLFVVSDLDAWITRNREREVL